MPRYVEAVLFDMDGTLVETEQYWGEALFELAARLGGRMSPAARERTVGTSMAMSMAVLDEDLGLRRSDDQRRADGRWVEERSRELMAEGIRWRPGARELLQEVRAAGPGTALVTATPRDVAVVVLERIAADLGGDPFDVTVCGDEAGAGKPDPAPYRWAMTALAAAPSACVVIEDSAVGVAAGLASGARVLGVPSLQRLEPAAGLTLRDSLAGVGLSDLVALLDDDEAEPAA